MSKSVRLVKGKVVVEGDFSEPERKLLTEKHASRREFEFWRTRLDSLAFLKDLPELESLSLINTRVEDATALSEVPTLKRLFLNEVKLGSGWSFVADLVQIEELHILNVRGALTLPDLGGLDQLKAFRIWGCKGFADISVLENAPQLEEVELVDTALTPDDLLPLLEKPSVEYVSCTFRTKKDNELFQTYLDERGKKAFRA